MVRLNPDRASKSYKERKLRLQLFYAVSLDYLAEAATAALQDDEIYRSERPCCIAA